MSFPHSCQSERLKGTGAKDSPPPLVLAPESALGSHSCVALSSAQANTTISSTSRTGKKALTQEPPQVVRTRELGNTRCQLLARTGHRGLGMAHRWSVWFRVSC